MQLGYILGSLIKLLKLYGEEWVCPNVQVLNDVLFKIYDLIEGFFNLLVKWLHIWMEAHLRKLDWDFSVQTKSLMKKKHQLQRPRNEPNEASENLSTTIFKGSTLFIPLLWILLVVLEYCDNLVDHKKIIACLVIWNISFIFLAWFIIINIFWLIFLFSSK